MHDEAGGPFGCPDVVVIGASSAGLRAAWAAAAGGASVTLLERRAALDVGEPPAAVAFDFLWRAGFVPPAATVRRRLSGLDIVSPGGRTFSVDAPLSIFRRAALDVHLAGLARTAGARIALGVRDIEILSPQEVVVDGVTLTPRVVIFADGARSLARRFVRPVEHADALTWGAALSVRAPGSGAAERVRISLGTHVRGGRAQLNPLGANAWSHWTFFRGDPADAEVRARAALRRDADALGWASSVVDEARFDGVAPDAVYMVPRELVANGVLLTGGAGGQGGLEVGLAAGELAGATAARAVAAGDTSKRGLFGYEEEWKRAHLAGYRALHREMVRLARLEDGDVDALFGPWMGRQVPLRDVVGLAHPSWLRRGESALKTLVAAPRATLSALRVARRMQAGAANDVAAGST